MILELQYKIKNDPNLQRFIKEHSYWYKELNRNPNNFKNFVYDMKDKYGLKTTDKLNKMLDNINMVQSVLSVFK